jgi:hypothetical protein
MADPIITVTTPVAPSATVTIGLPGWDHNAGDWVGLFNPGDPNTRPATYGEIDPFAADTLPAPATPNPYQFRVFFGATATTVRATAPLIVSSTLPQITLTTPVTPRSTVFVSVTY